MTNQADGYLCKLSRAPTPIVAPVFKFGGSPVFFHETLWPLCRHCGKEMDFLAQIPLQNPLHFSDRYNMAYIFMCPGQFDERGWLECKNWDPESGANKVILQAASDLVTVVDRASEYPDYVVALEHVTEPIVDTSDYQLSDELLHAVHETSKLGGVPTWLQANETPPCPICNGTTKYIAQIDAELDGSLPAVSNEDDHEKYKFFHFGGDDGIGYVFLCVNECDPESGSFLWQCT